MLARSLKARAGSLYGVRGGVCPGVGPEAWLKWSAHPFRGAAGMRSALLLLPALCVCSLPFRRGSCVFEVFCTLSSIICPNWACTQLFLVPYTFFVFLCLRILQVEAGQQRVPGPRSQVPTCLTMGQDSKASLPHTLRSSSTPLVPGPRLSAGSPATFTHPSPTGQGDSPFI